MTDRNPAAPGASMSGSADLPDAMPVFATGMPDVAPPVSDPGARRATNSEPDAPPVQLPSAVLDAPVEVIDTRDGYLEAVAAIRAGTGPVAVDAERASGFRYSQRAYLIQLYRRGAGTFLFDPPAIGGFSELNEAIVEEEWVLHAASQDLACLREVGLDPTRLFDTELAARLLGLQRVGLGAVVEDLLGLHLAKEHSAADWSKRPLPANWLVYAALDVQLLIDVRDRMVELLAEQRKERIAAEEFRATLDREAKQTRTDQWRKLSGLHSVRGARALAVAKELWTARDQLARDIDSAPGRLIPDASLIAAVKAMPATKRDLASLRDFTGRSSRAEIDRWWSAIERGLATTELPQLRTPNETLPPPRTWSDKNPEADRRFRGARATLTEVAGSLALPLENLLTPEILRKLAWAPPASNDAAAVSAELAALGARPWQIEATAQAIADAFVVAHQPGAEAPEPAS